MLMAELPYMFDKIAHFDNQENSLKIDVMNDSLVFVAGGDRGLCAYKYNGFSLNFITSINSNNNVIEVAVNNNGIIFSTATDGLSAYSFQDGEFTLIDNLPNEGTDVIRGDMKAGGNNTVYCTQYAYGLAIYSLIDGTLVKRASLDVDAGNYDCYNVALGSDGNVFLSNVNECPPEIRAFYWNGATLNYQNSIREGYYPVGIIDIDADQNNFIIGSSTLPSGVSLNHYNGTGFSRLGNISNLSGCVKAAGENLFFLGEWSFLSALSYSDSSFSKISYIAVSGINDIAVASDSTVFCARKENGISVYKFNVSGFHLISQTSSINNEQGAFVDPIFELTQNHPNPFNPTTTIRYQLPAVCDVDIAIYDLSGCRINQWSYQNQTASTYEIIWNGKDQNGNPVPSGVYIYRMVAENFVESRKMVLLK